MAPIFATFSVVIGLKLSICQILHNPANFLLICIFSLFNIWTISCCQSEILNSYSIIIAQLGDFQLIFPNCLIFLMLKYKDNTIHIRIEIIVNSFCHALRILLVLIFKYIISIHPIESKLICHL